MLRRNLISAVPALAASALALAACASGTPGGASGNATVAVTLASAQAEAQAIEDALTREAAILGSNLSAAGQAALNALKAAVSSFVAIPSNASPKDYASAVVRAVATVLPFFNLPGATVTAINLGLALISGLVSNMTSITVPVSSVSTAVGLSYAAPTVQAPIPIPVR